MKKVRFLKSCYNFSDKTVYNIGLVAEIKKELAHDFFNRGIVDSFKDDKALYRSGE